MVSDQLLIHLLHAARTISRISISYVVVVQAALIGNLMRDELSMVSRGYALIDELSLLLLADLN